MRIVVLGSGSSGNSTLIETGRTRILVDAGFGTRSLKRRIREAGIRGDGFEAILLTHGHTDHVLGAAALARSENVPVYVNEGTLGEVPELRSLQNVVRFSSGVPFAVREIIVEAFPVSHDSAEPVGFRLTAQGISGALATDLGEMTPPVIRGLATCDWLVLESNHDEEMLKIGPYPWPLKQRVLGRNGHLSNRALAEFLAGTFDGQASYLFLAHLSRQNNHPELALESASEALSRRRLSGARNGTRLHLTHQSKPSIVLDL